MSIHRSASTGWALVSRLSSFQSTWYSFENAGFPLRVYGGVNVNWYPGGLLEDLGIGGVAMGWHIGAIVPF